jgi:alpha-2-macroglobulin
MKTFKNITDFFIKIPSKIPYFSYIVGLIIITVFTGVLYYAKHTFLDTSFIVQASNFDANYRKIPVDIGYIDFTLSKNINPKSIDTKSIIVSPKLDGQVKLISENTLRYLFLAPLEVGQNFNMSLSPDIESQDGKKLGAYNYDIIISEQAKVTRITPSGKLENLGQNIAVFFNVPMIPLSDITTKENLPCPIKIEPNIEGTCKWTTSSVLEFIPKTSLKWATKYHVNIENTGALLYPFQSGSGVNIETPHLETFTSENFSVSEGIELRFNFPINVDALKASLELKQEKEWKLTNKSFEIIPSKESEAVFTLLISWEKFLYDTNYEVTVKKWLFPKYGNIPLGGDFKKIIHSYPFLRSVNVYRNILSNTGSLIDTRTFYQGDKLPVKNVMFHLDFEEEIPSLDSSNFIFQGPNWPVTYDIAYRDEEIYNLDGTKKIQKNKKQISLTLKSNLSPTQNYSLIIKKEISKNLTADIVSPFTTADALKVTKLDFVDYKKYCLYTNNTIVLADTSKTTIPSISPTAKVMSIDGYQWLPYEVQSLTGSALKEKWYCLERAWEIMTVINPRLSPNTDYTLWINAGIEDVYGNTLVSPLNLKVKTGEIKEEDKYLYTSVTKDINFIPSSLPINVNLQSINMTGAKLDVCELDDKWFMDYRTNGYNSNFILRCKNKYSKEVALKNHLWNISNNVFDIEKDIVGEPLSEKYILIRWYKNKEKSFATLYIRGNLNLTLEAAGNKSLLFVSDFDGNPVKEPLSLTFYRFDSNSQAFKIVTPKYTLSKDGLVYELENSDFSYVFAKNSQYSWVLDTSNDGLSNDDFGYIWWVSSFEKNYAYIYTERPIYKPGDTVYIKGIVRKFDFDGYKKVGTWSGKLEILDKDFNTIYTSQIPLDTNSNFSTNFILPREVPLGEFRVRFTFGQNEFMNNASFYVEEYRKPDFKIDAETTQKDIRFGETFAATLSPKYYFWWSIINAKGKYSLLTQNYFFDAKDFSNYQFGEWYAYFDCIYWGACSYNDNLSGLQDFEVKQWKYVFAYTLPKEVDGEKIYSFNFDIQDPNTSKTVSKTLSVVAHTTDAYVGLQTNYWNTPKTWIQAAAVTLNYDAKPVASKKIKATLIKREWKSVKKQWVDGIFYEDYALEEKEETSTNYTTDASGIANITFSPKDTGEYMLKVSYTGTNGKTFTSSSIIYVSGEEYTLWNNGNNDITELVSLKPQVNVGENAEYVLKSPVNTWKALIVIVKDEGILDYMIHDISSYGDKITIPVKNSYYPNYYVKAFLVWTQEKNPLPIYKRALTVTKVNTGYKNLKVHISPEKKNYTPREKVKLTISVTDSAWKPVPNANGSLSLVDESLLALKGNPKKNPYAFFYDMRRYLGTYTSSLYKNLIEKLEIKDTSNGEKWGAGDQIKWGDSKKARGLFKDTAFWQANFTTDVNGKTTILTSELPDNLTTWVIEALVVTPENTRVGVGYETVMTTKSLLIQENLPNFVASNDTITLSPVIFNKTWKSGEFEISLTGKNFTLLSKKIDPIFIENGASKVVPLQVKIRDRGLFPQNTTPFVTFQIDAKMKGNNQSDTVIKHLELKENSVRETTATTGKTQSIASDEKIDISNIKQGFPTLKLTYGATLFSSVTESIDYLANYPYGCSEQKTSSVLPNIVIKKLYDTLGQPFDLKTKMVKYFDSETGKEKEKSLDQVIQEYLTDIRKYQKNDGGFVYWYDIDNNYPNYSDFSLSSYILKANSQIRDAGYTLDDDTFKKLEKYLKTRFYKNQREGCVVTKYDDCKYDELQRLESIEAILTYKKNDYEAYKMYTLLDFKNPSVSTLLKKVKVIALLKDIPTLVTSQKEKLITEGQALLQTVQNEELVLNPKGAYIGRSTLYSRIQNTALFLENVALFWPKNFADQEVLVDNIQRWIMSQKRDGSFGSTQDTIATIQAISSYLASTWEAKNTSFQAQISLNGKSALTQLFTSKNFLESLTHTFSGSELASNNTLNFTQEGKGTLYYDMNLGYYLPSEMIQARDEGFSLTSDYYDFEEYKKVEWLKKTEWEKYLSGSLSSDELKYPKSVFEYITPLSSWNVGQLVIAHSQVINAETRDKVAFESYIPSGSEIVNPNLDTSSKTAFEFMDSPFEKTEYRTDRFFWYTQELQPWIHAVSYLLRLTHAGDFGIKPTQAYEFYHTEVFGRTAWKRMNIQ